MAISLEDNAGVDGDRKSVNEPVLRFMFEEDLRRLERNAELEKRYESIVSEYESMRPVHPDFEDMIKNDALGG